MVDQIWLWVGFNGFVLAMLAVELSLRSMARSISRIQSRTAAIDARTSYFKRTAISCCVISPRTWPRNSIRCSMGFCER